MESDVLSFLIVWPRDLGSATGGGGGRGQSCGFPGIQVPFRRFFNLLLFSGKLSPSPRLSIHLYRGVQKS